MIATKSVTFTPRTFVANAHILDNPYRWESWAAPKGKDGKIDHNTALSGDDLLAFVNQKLLSFLHGFKQKATGPNTIEYKIGEIFGELKNRIQSAYNLREINVASEQTASKLKIPVDKINDRFRFQFSVTRILESHGRTTCSGRSNTAAASGSFFCAAWRTGEKSHFPLRTSSQGLHSNPQAEKRLFSAQISVV